MKFIIILMLCVFSGLKGVTQDDTLYYLNPEAQKKLIVGLERELSNFATDSLQTKGYYIRFAGGVYGSLFFYQKGVFRVYNYSVDTNGKLQKKVIPPAVVYISNLEVLLSLKDSFFDGLEPKTWCSNPGTYLNDDRYFSLFKKDKLIEQVHYSIRCLLAQKEFLSTLTDSILETLSKRGLTSGL